MAISLEDAERLSENAGRDGVTLTRGDAIPPEEVDWLWPGWLARRKISVFAGPPGVAKTTIALDVASSVTRGDELPDGSMARLGSVAIWSGEDDAADTLVPRLIAAGASMTKIYFVGPVREKGEKFPFDPSRHMPALRHDLARIDDIALLILDPIVSAVNGDSHNNSETRRSLQPVVDLAVAANVAVLGITHFTKGSMGRDPVERVNGSLAFGALARCVWVATKDGSVESDDRRILARAKGNNGPDDGGFYYTLAQVGLHEHPAISASTICWGDAIAGNAREILSGAEVLDTGDKSALDEACDFLLSQLEGGGVAVKALMARARENAISQMTLRRGADKLGVIKKKIGFGPDARTIWNLPGVVGADADVSQETPAPPVAEPAQEVIEPEDISI